MHADDAAEKRAQRLQVAADMVEAVGYLIQVAGHAQLDDIKNSLAEVRRMLLFKIGVSELDRTIECNDENSNAELVENEPE